MLVLVLVLVMFAVCLCDLCQIVSLLLLAFFPFGGAVFFLFFFFWQQTAKELGAGVERDRGVVPCQQQPVRGDRALSRGAS